MNKVKFGLKNVHYSAITEAGSVITYATPVEIPGAVNLSLSPAGETTTFYADDVPYFITNSNAGYIGTLELALIPDKFKKEILGYKEDDNGVLFEDSQAIAKDFALLFEFTGDSNAVRHIMYKVNAARPNVEGSTTGNAREVKTETLNITATPAADTKLVKAKVEPTQAIQYAAWYTNVYTYIEPVIP